VKRGLTVEAPLTETLARLDDDCDAAADAAGRIVEVNLTIAARSVSIRFAGETAADALAPAFAHLESEDSEPPTLTLSVWDAVTAGAERPAFASSLPVPEADARASGAGPSYYTEDEDVRVLRQPAVNAFSVLTAAADRGWFWTPDARALPYWEYTAPFRHLLSWWLEACGLCQVHAGAVGTEDGGVLLVGAGGSGKSTSALACLLDERLRYAGDDYVAVDARGTPAVYSLYCSGKVHRDDLRRLPHLEPALVDRVRPDEKAVFNVEGAFPGRATGGFPLRAIVVPRVTDRHVARVRPAPQAVALSALAPSTIFQLHPPAGKALAYMGELVRKVPTFVLELGSDVETIPAELVRLLDRVR
jgi:hypothetical protein